MLISDSCISKVVYWLSGQYPIIRHLDGHEEIITIDCDVEEKEIERTFMKS